MNRVMRILAELWAARDCLLTGHEPMLGWGDREVFLKCRACLLRTDGWQLPARPVPAVPTAADRVRARIAAEARAAAVEPWAAGAVTGWDYGSGDSVQVAAVYARQGPDVVFVGTLDDVMATVIGELDMAGDYGGVQLALMPVAKTKH